MTRNAPQLDRHRPDADLGWDDLKIILAIADHGSLTRAARALGLTQPTVGRRLAAFEARCGQVFERTPDGLLPTTVGAALLDELGQMQDLAASIQRSIASRDRALSGRVTISATAWFGSHIVTPLMSRFLLEHPGISLEMRAGWRDYSLAKREADIAFRAAPFDQENLIQRKVGEIAFGLFASEAYLARSPTLDFANGGVGHRLVMLDGGAGPSLQAQTLALLLPRGEIVWRTDNSDSLLRAAEAGIGLALLPILQAPSGGVLVRIQTPRSFDPRPIWLGFHPELRATPRIRAVVNFLCAGIPALTRSQDEVSLRRECPCEAVDVADPIQGQDVADDLFDPNPPSR